MGIETVAVHAHMEHPVERSLTTNFLSSWQVDDTPVRERVDVFCPPPLDFLSMLLDTGTASASLRPPVHTLATSSARRQRKIQRTVVFLYHFDILYFKPRSSVRREAANASASI